MSLGGYIAYDMVRGHARAYRNAVRSHGRSAPRGDSTITLPAWADALGTAAVILGVTLLVCGVYWGAQGARIGGTVAGLVCLGIIWEHLPRTAAARQRIEAKEAARRAKRRT